MLMTVAKQELTAKKDSGCILKNTNIIVKCECLLISDDQIHIQIYSHLSATFSNVPFGFPSFHSDLSLPRRVNEIFSVIIKCISVVLSWWFSITIPAPFSGLVITAFLFFWGQFSPQSWCFFTSSSTFSIHSLVFVAISHQCLFKLAIFILSRCH